MQVGPPPVGGGWASRTRRALLFGLSGWEPAAVALVGFVLRGGILPLALPGVVLPSVITIAGLTGLNAFTIAGQPTPWFIGMGILLGFLFCLWFVLAGLVGAVADVWLVRAVLGDGRATLRQAQVLPDGTRLLEMLAIRTFCLIPLFAVFVWSVGQVASSTYNELITPSDLSTPLPLRVIGDAGGSIAILVAAWLAMEILAAIAVRRLLLNDRGLGDAFGGALALLIRRPISWLATIVVSYGLSFVVLALPLLATYVVFGWVSDTARIATPIALTIPLGPLTTTRDLRPLALLGSAVVLILVWFVAFALAGIASAWRSALFTQEVAAASAPVQSESPNPHTASDPLERL